MRILLIEYYGWDGDVVAFVYNYVLDTEVTLDEAMEYHPDPDGAAEMVFDATSTTILQGCIYTILR